MLKKLKNTINKFKNSIPFHFDSASISTIDSDWELYHDFMFSISPKTIRWTVSDGELTASPIHEDYDNYYIGKIVEIESCLTANNIENDNMPSDILNGKSERVELTGEEYKRISSPANASISTPHRFFNIKFLDDAISFYFSIEPTERHVSLRPMANMTTPRQGYVPVSIFQSARASFSLFDILEARVTLPLVVHRDFFRLTDHSFSFNFGSSNFYKMKGMHSSIKQIILTFKGRKRITELFNEIKALDPDSNSCDGVQQKKEKSDYTSSDFSLFGSTGRRR